MLIVGFIVLALAAWIVRFALSRPTSTTPALSRGSRVRLSLGGLFFALVGAALVYGGLATPNQPEPSSAANPPTPPVASSVTPSSTPATEKPLPTPPASPAPRAQPRKPEPPTIPGASWVDVTANLEPEGFSFTPRASKGGLTERCASRLDDAGVTTLQVCVSSFGDRLVHVDATAVGGDASEVAAQFLSYLASLPFDDNPQTASQDWVAASVGTVRQGQPRTRLVNGVVLEVFGTPPGAFSLEIKPRTFEAWASQVAR